MKAHTSEFKDKIKTFGRQIDSRITYELNGATQIITTDNINSVTPTYQGSILKSVMKELEIDVNVDIPVGTILTYKFGLKTSNGYEYLNFGNYVVKSSEKQEDTSSYKLTCYDKLLYSMKQNEDLEVVYPITIRDYIKAICTKLGLTFKNETDTFVNYNKQITKELYVGLDYTYRDILDELAQVTASTICLTSDDKLELRYISDTAVDTFDEEYLKDVNVNFGEKYGPINSIVLSRSAESDNVYKEDTESVTANGRTEIKIIDNQIMNWDDRSTYLDEILSKLDGLEYYINDFTSTGICYLELCDRYNVKIGNTTYSCVMLNDEIDISQGLSEAINCELPEEAETDYSKSDKTDRKINGVNLIVDKQNKTIEALSTEVTETAEKTAEIELKVDGITTQVSETVKSIGKQYRIKGTTEWKDTQPTRQTGQILEARDVYQHTDGSITYGTPYDITGDKGDTGEQGIQGEKGETGAKGDKGEQGIQGEKGEKGDTGQQGIQGEKGEKGDTGEKGTDGTNGKDGQTFYTWIKYADSPTSGMSDNPTGKEYIGIAYNKSSSTESTNYSDYSWSKIKGEQGIQGEKGEQGIQGEQGAKGDTGEQGIQGEKGDTGQTGATGNGISTINYYYATTTTQTAPSASSITSTTIPTLSETDKYLWQKEVITFTQTTSPQTTVSLIGVYGDKGNTGATGANGKDGTNGKDGADGKDAAIKSATAPTDTSQLWYDTVNNVIKSYNSETSSWEIVNDYSDELGELDNLINQVDSNVTKNKTETDTALQNLDKRFDNYATNESVTTQINSVKQDITSNQASIEVIQETITNGVSTVKNTIGTFDLDGLHIEKAGGKVKSTLDEAGLTIQDTNTNAISSYNGYVDSTLSSNLTILKGFEGQTVNYNRNIIVDQFIIIGGFRIEVVKENNVRKLKIYDVGGDN